MWISGIDEAGKGPVLGPMVAAGVAVEDLSLLSGMGINDSKKLTAKRREELYSEITSHFRYAVVIRSPEEIDNRAGTMNEFTVACHAEVLRELHPDVVYLDACDVNANRFGANVVAASGIETNVISEHKADAKFEVVGAASIVAKVTRDRLIEELKEEFGDIGSGYPSDPVTIAFLMEYIQKNGKVPSCARKSWQTVTDIIGKSAQKSIDSFF